MDPRDRPSDVGEGVECAACGRPVPPDAVRVLASRDDLLFAEGLCVPCGSVSLAILVAPAQASVNASRDEAAGGPPIGAADVLAVRELLDGWTGDLRSLVGPRRPRPGPEAA